MCDTHLRNIDLNLLRAIQPLLEERHISRAAKRAFLSQPAMSRALNRLRATFGDPLLVRSDGTYERTPRPLFGVTYCTDPGGTFEKSGPSPSAIVGWTRTASRSLQYGRVTSI